MLAKTPPSRSLVIVVRITLPGGVKTRIFHLWDSSGQIVSVKTRRPKIIRR